jgi:hypothetical protein
MAASAFSKLHGAAAEACAHAERELQVHAGPRAREHLRQHRGLARLAWAADVRVVGHGSGGRAQGPDALLLPLDRYLLPAAAGGPLAAAARRQTVHLLGASIGAWRMAAACRTDADAALAQLAEDYVARPTRTARPHAQARGRVAPGLGATPARAPGRNGRRPSWRTRNAGCMCSPAAASRWLHRPGPVAGHATGLGRGLRRQRAQPPGPGQAGWNEWSSATRVSHCR